MARETKLGLLAGLAFIICFAIILANRGRPIPNADYQFARKAGNADGRPPGPASAQKTTHSPGPTQPHTAQTGKDRDPYMVNPQTHPVSATPGPRRAPSSGASVVLDELGRAQSQWGLEELREGGAGKGLPGPGTDKTARQLDLQERLADLSAKLDVIARSQRGGPGAGTSEPRSSPARRNTTEASRGLKPAARLQGRREESRYTVVPGDTLTKIAADHYGTRFRTAVNAIFDANRSVLRSPDHLGVGVELILPALEGLGRTTDLTMTTHPQASPTTALIRTDGPGADLGFRWYQIEKGEGYSSIARKQLGDSSRWSEIFELNKDKFPDPNRIREGVRIKIPAAGSTRAKEKRR